MMAARRPGSFPFATAMCSEASRCLRRDIAAVPSMPQDLQQFPTTGDDIEKPSCSRPRPRAALSASIAYLNPMPFPMSFPMSTTVAIAATGLSMNSDSRPDCENFCAAGLVIEARCRSRSIMTGNGRFFFKVFFRVFRRSVDDRRRERHRASMTRPAAQKFSQSGRESESHARGRKLLEALRHQRNGGKLEKKTLKKNARCRS